MSLQGKAAKLLEEELTLHPDASAPTFRCLSQVSISAENAHRTDRKSQAHQFRSSRFVSAR